MAPNGAPTERTSLLPQAPQQDEPRWKSIPKKVVRTTWATLASNYVNVLLVFVPIGIIAGELGWSPTAVFILNFIAIVPLASLLSFATEELSAKLGQTLGGLCNATFGNAVELIVSGSDVGYPACDGTLVLTIHALGVHCGFEEQPDPNCPGQYARQHSVQHASCRPSRLMMNP